MAQKVKVLLIDDVDGTDAVETVSFGLDGVQYEIDLNEENAAKLRDDLANWVARSTFRRPPAHRSWRRPVTLQFRCFQDPGLGPRTRVPGLRPWARARRGAGGLREG